jgi:ribosomal protein S12 methylthiotransferase accessory factor
MSAIQAGSVWNLERSIDPDEALQRIEAIFSELGFHPDLEVVDADFMVSYAVLYDEHESPLAKGGGKGRFATCGALAELLEHYASTLALSRSIRTVMPMRRILEQPALRREGILQACADLGSLPVVVQEFRSVRDGQPCFIPCQLINPDWRPLEGESAPACDRLVRYAVNSGYAFGLTLHDALLHGLNEVIEHHVASQLYLHWVGLPSDAQFYELAARAWPDDLTALARGLESRCDAQIELVLADSGFSTWCAIAIGRSKSAHFALPQVGSGSSFYPELAVRRAVAELVQCCVLYDETVRQEDEKAIALTREFPGYEPAVFLPAGALRWPVLGALPSGSGERLPPERQWARICEAVERRGYTVHMTEVARLGADGVIAQVFVPGLERFDLIRLGSVVAPQAVLLAGAAI